MEDQIKERVEALKKKRRNRSLISASVAGGIIVSLVSGYFLFQQVTGKDVAGPEPEVAAEHVQQPPPPPSPAKSLQEYRTDSLPVEVHDPIGDIISSSKSEQVLPPQSQQTAAEVEQPAVEQEVQQDAYEAAVERIRKFYSELDRRRYIKEYSLKAPSEVYFSSLAQKALDTPPIVSGETDDLFNVLKNTAHFFRVVGKRNIIILKSILHEEKKSYEGVLADYYLLSQKPEYLEKEFGLQVTEAALLDYSGFFLNTMGGRLYLFRRDSVSRMLVNYYAILTVDRANQETRNSYGIDIKPAVAALIGELETSSAKLRLKDTYLDTLYSLQERY